MASDDYDEGTAHGAGACGGDSLAELTRLAARLSSEDAGRDLAGLGVPALGEQLVALRSVIDRLEASFTTRLAPFDRCGGARSFGAASTTGWLKSSCGMLDGAASERVRIARHLPDLPSSATAFADGDVSYGHAVVLSRVARDVGPDTARRAGPALTEAAAWLSPDRLKPVGDRLRYCLDPDGTEADARAMHERRRLHLSETLDGLVVLDGLLDPESGAVVRTALGALTPPPGPGEERTAAQRRADALVELAGHAMDTGKLPDVGGARPQLTITATAETLAKLHDASTAKTPERQTGTSCAQTETGTVLPGESARRVGCDATVTRVLVDAGSQPLDVGRATRVVPTPIRKALAVRDQGCAYSGCDRPPAWTDAHHLVSWLDGGATSLDNLVLLCRPHHRMMHDNQGKLPDHDHHDGHIPRRSRPSDSAPAGRGPSDTVPGNGTAGGKASGQDTPRSGVPGGLPRGTGPAGSDPRNGDSRDRISNGVASSGRDPSDRNPSGRISSGRDLSSRSGGEDDARDPPAA